jgi:uncharacterized LabA/DUF88 family protein
VRVRIFIDFWNFQLHWNDRLDPQRCDWRALPPALMAQAGLLLQPMGVSDPLTLEETLLYASVDQVTEGPLKAWLMNTIDRMPSYRVTVRERRAQPKTIHCRHCGAEFDHCPQCGQRYTPKTEKGVDAAIVTDLLSLAFRGSYDLAILVTGDADFIPAVKYLQSTGSRVINAGWGGHGHDLKRACWASFDLDAVAPGICRP